MKTKERIIVTSLELFNFFGEPNVTTVDIANEMDISPGNLYYHYRNKDEIILELLERYESEMNGALSEAESYLLGIEELWMFAHLIFEKIWQFRFLYRDLNNLISKEQKFSRRFQRLLRRQEAAVEGSLLALADGGVLRGSQVELDALKTQIVFNFTFWLSYNNLSDKPEQFGVVNLHEAVKQLMLLASPYLSPSNREMIADFAVHMTS